MESVIEAEFSSCHGRAELLLLLLSNVQNVYLRLEPALAFELVSLIQR